MKQGYVALILVFNLALSIEKCGFNIELIDDDRHISNCTNLMMQRTITSPSGLFYIHYDTTGYEAVDLLDLNPEDGIPDYINEVSQVADSSYRLLNEILGFKDGSNGNDNITDIFVIELDGSAYGWARPINSCNDSCVEIDNNYEEPEYYTNGVDAMKVTLIHEYFHTIQFAYRCSPGINSYFYELTSTWIEDLGYPDVNDYINFMVSSNSYKNYYKYPDQDFDDTNGYSVALFGHYLGTQLENQDGIEYDDEFTSLVMNKIWDRLDNTSNTAIAAIDYILESEYGTSFNNVWVDFNTRNLFNQIDEEMYYYEDQSLLDKINIDDYTLIDENSYNSSFGLNYKSVIMPSFSLYNRGKINIDITANDELVFGNMVIISEDQNMFVPIFSGSTQIFNEDDMLYFIFGTDENDVSINLNLDPSYVPSEPENIFSLIGTDFIDLWWDHLDSILPDSYNVYRDGILIDTIVDPLYTDNNVNSNSQYFYEVTAQNEIGSSNPIVINIDTTNPDYPLKPESLFSVIDNEKNHLWWSTSVGIGDISYVIFRNLDSIDTVIDTFYYDYEIESDTFYEYSIYAVNKVGRSIDSISINATSWPASESIQKNSIVNIYPNPIDLSLNRLNIILDVNDTDPFSDIILYDINGREIKRWNNIQLNQGRQRIELENIISIPISSGFYFISNNNQSIPIVIRN